MDTKLLKDKAYNLTTAYLIFFTIQAPYGYVNKWWYQILYWIAAAQFYSTMFRILGIHVDPDAEASQVMLSSIIAIIFAIWALHIFLSLPNMVKKKNLKLYEELLNTK